MHSDTEALLKKNAPEASADTGARIIDLFGPPIFASLSMRRVIQMVRQVAPSDMSVLITGETGTGKEVIADLIHSESNRANSPIVKANCAAIPSQLIESEMFGSVRGAFTGAIDRDGLFHQANGGTLFLDEIAEMPADLQTKLLRVLQDGKVRKVGDKIDQQVNCRIIAATNCDIEAAVSSGKLRADLLYRVGAFRITLPPLREREEDILILSTFFLRKLAGEKNQKKHFSADALKALSAYSFPGNVRELLNIVQCALVLSNGSDIIDVEHLQLASETAMNQSLDESLTLMEQTERNAILAMLAQTGNNKLETAKRLGIGRQTLYNKLKSYGISDSAATPRIETTEFSYPGRCITEEALTETDGNITQAAELLGVSEDVVREKIREYELPYSS